MSIDNIDNLEALLEKRLERADAKQRHDCCVVCGKLIPSIRQVLEPLSDTCEECCE